jgi:hypothetical protein
MDGRPARSIILVLPMMSQRALASIGVVKARD